MHVKQPRECGIFCSPLIAFRYNERSQSDQFHRVYQSGNTPHGAPVPFQFCSVFGAVFWSFFATFIEPLPSRLSALKQSDSQLVQHSVCFDTHTGVLIFLAIKRRRCAESQVQKHKESSIATPSPPCRPCLAFNLLKFRQPP